MCIILFPCLYTCTKSVYQHAVIFYGIHVPLRHHHFSAFDLYRLVCKIEAISLLEYNSIYGIK